MARDRIFKKETVRLGPGSEYQIVIKVSGDGKFSCEPPDPVMAGTFGPRVEGDTAEKVRMLASQWMRDRLRDGLKWELSIVTMADYTDQIMIGGGAKVGGEAYFCPMWVATTGGKSWYCVALNEEQARIDRTCDDDTKAPVESQNGYWRRPGDAPRALPPGMRVLPYSPGLWQRLSRFAEILGGVRRVCSHLSLCMVPEAASIMAIIEKEFPDVAS